MALIRAVVMLAWAGSPVVPVELRPLALISPGVLLSFEHSIDFEMGGDE